MESLVRCARYARISLDKAGDEHGVANQLADQQRVADTSGFVIVRTEVDNDISALNGKHRPGYEAVIAAAARGVVEHEAAVVRQMFTRFYAGDSLRGIVAWLAAQGVPTRSGRPWNPSSVRTILTNPRYAGRVVYHGQYPGEVNGKMGAWPQLVEEWLFDAVQAKLSDPRRRKQIGTHRKHLGSGLYLCGVC